MEPETKQLLVTRAALAAGVWRARALLRWLHAASAVPPPLFVALARGLAVDAGTGAAA